MVCEARVVFALSFVIMDLYLEQFLSPSSWTDLNTRDRSSWILNEPCQTNGLFPNSIGMYEGNREEPILGMTRSCNALECLTSQNNRPFIDKGPVSHIGMANTLECLTSQNNKPFLNKGPISHISKSTLMDEAQLQQGSQYIGDDAFLNELLSIGSNVEYMGLQLNAATSDPNSLDYHFPEGPPGAVGLDKSPHFHMPTDTGYGGSESYDYQNILGDQVLSAFPNLQRPVSIDDVFSSPFGQERLKGFGFQGECVGSEHLMWNKYVGEDTIMQLDNLYEPVSSKENEMLQNHSLSTFPGGPQITMPSVGLQSLPQLVELSEGSLNERPKNLMCDPQPENALVPSSRCCNGNGKPRVRARRGQATDPHSIAERLRREKIAERMRSLQELLPNSNKTDKASMLDEIIEYVKFLQLQIKVLSTRKLAAAGEAVPPMEDSLAQDSINLLPPPSSVQGTNTSRSPDQLVLEKEVTELMESNFRMAVQYLETKGLCLMPIALVTAITNEKKVSDPPVSEEQKNHVSGSTLLNGETKKMNLAKEQ